ncbi:DUF5994 family protein [Streptomyces luteogriseus]|uniref:DUF5994 family protein n=1 Tax=Streptomyces luteogriseus TaxID=68233 RepID=UPI0037FB826B
MVRVRFRPAHDPTLQQLLAALPRTWGHIAGVTVNGASWSAAPGRMFVANQVVRLRKAVAVHAPDTVVLLAPGHGRWDLLVVPPGTTAERGGNDRLGRARIGLDSAAWDEMPTRMTIDNRVVHIDVFSARVRFSSPAPY